MAADPMTFESRLTTQLIAGPGCVARVGSVARNLGIRRALLVTDHGVRGAGHDQPVIESLRGSGIAVELFDAVRENPTTADVEACRVVAAAADIDGIVGLGGGSSMDTAKGCNFVLTNGGCMQDYWGIGKATKPMLPLIAIPTTAGTGSECQSFALIADDQTHRKMACGDAKAAARVAMLDPLLTLTQPRRVAACTGIDAVSHALESAVTSRRNSLSSLFAREAFRLTAGHFEAVLDGGSGDIVARAAMQLGAAYAGCAIEHSMLGAAHAAANPLTAFHEVVHGEAVGLMLPHVIRFNADDPQVAGVYAELARGVGWAEASLSVGEAVESLCQALEALLAHAGLARRLTDVDVSPDDIDGLAVDAAQQWTGTFNPRPVSKAVFVQLYRAALGEAPPVSVARQRSITS